MSSHLARCIAHFRASSINEIEGEDLNSFTNKKMQKKLLIGSGMSCLWQKVLDESKGQVLVFDKEVSYDTDRSSLLERGQLIEGSQES